MLPGNLFAPFHWNDLFGPDLAVNAVTNDAVDPISFQPEFKVAAVALAKLPAIAEAPAPQLNLAGTEVSGSAALVGASRPEQLEDTVKASDITLSDDAYAAVNDALRPVAVIDGKETYSVSPASRVG